MVIVDATKTERENPLVRSSSGFLVLFFLSFNPSIERKDLVENPYQIDILCKLDTLLKQEQWKYLVQYPYWIDIPCKSSRTAVSQKIQREKGDLARVILRDLLNYRTTELQKLQRCQKFVCSFPCKGKS